MPMLVSPHLESSGLKELRRQQDTEVLDTAKLALSVQPSSHGSEILPSFFLPSHEPECKVNCNLVCTRALQRMSGHFLAPQLKSPVGYSVQDIRHRRESSSHDLKISSALDTHDNVSQSQIKN